MRIFFEILVRIGSFRPQLTNRIALSSSELVCGLPPPHPLPHGSSNTFCPFASDWDRTSEDRLRDKRLSSHATNSANKLKKLYDNDWYEPSFRGKFITDLIQMIGLHDASWIRRLTQHFDLGKPKLELVSRKFPRLASDLATYWVVPGEKMCALKSPMSQIMSKYVRKSLWNSLKSVFRHQKVPHPPRCCTAPPLLVGKNNVPN